MPETRAAFAVALDLAATVEDVTERFPAYFGVWSGSIGYGGLKPMQDAAATFLRDVESCPTVLNRPQWLIGFAALPVGMRAISMRRGNCLEQALAIARHREPILHFNLDVTSTAMVFLPLVLWPLGLLITLVLVEKAVYSALQTGHIPSIVLVYLYAADFEMMRRDRSGPRRWCKRFWSCPRAQDT